MTYARLKASISALDVLVTCAEAECCRTRDIDNQYVKAKQQEVERQIIRDAIKEAQALTRNLKERLNRPL